MQFRENHILHDSSFGSNETEESVFSLQSLYYFFCKISKHEKLIFSYFISVLFTIVRLAHLANDLSSFITTASFFSKNQRRDKVTSCNAHSQIICSATRCPSCKAGVDPVTCSLLLLLHNSCVSHRPFTSRVTSVQIKLNSFHLPSSSSYPILLHHHTDIPAGKN